MNYPGGKNGNGAFQKIICQIPPHDVYIEPFLGSGAVLRNKKPAQVNFGLDLSIEAIDTFNYGGPTPGFIVKKGCAISFLESYAWQGREFVYCDPPYLMNSRRRQSRIYLYEMTEADHRRLLAIIKTIPTMCAISGYYSELYIEELKQWRYITFPMMTRGGKLATEYLWMNYTEPKELHDYSFLGEDFTDRQRIKRKKQRLIKKLERMSTLERYAMLSAIQDYSGKK